MVSSNEQSACPTPRTPAPTEEQMESVEQLKAPVSARDYTSSIDVCSPNESGEVEVRDEKIEQDMPRPVSRECEPLVEESVIAEKLAEESEFDETDLKNAVQTLLTRVYDNALVNLGEKLPPPLEDLEASLERAPVDLLKAPSSPSPSRLSLSPPPSLAPITEDRSCFNSVSPEVIMFSDMEISSPISDFSRNKRASEKNEAGEAIMVRRPSAGVFLPSTAEAVNTPVPQTVEDEELESNLEISRFLVKETVQRALERQLDTPVPCLTLPEETEKIPTARSVEKIHSARSATSGTVEAAQSVRAVLTSRTGSGEALGEAKNVEIPTPVAQPFARPTSGPASRPPSRPASSEGMVFRNPTPMSTPMIGPVQYDRMIVQSSPMPSPMPSPMSMSNPIARPQPATLHADRERPPKKVSWWQSLFCCGI